ncbi:MAG TPA: alpha/beta hydrolase-fold protein [Streptosporangiaceae bacterium]|nr:alpha/beta hydrolase-fold protein [Streptosporangiaceae bacterium]
MGLTSGAFATVMFVAAGASLALVVLLWPVASRQRVGPILSRLAMIVVSQLLVITAFLVWLNGYFDFYSSWSQLLGSGTAPIVGVAKQATSSGPLLTVIASGPAPAPGVASTKKSGITVVAGRGGSPVSGRAADLAKTGELLEVNITGEHTGIAVSDDFVYLPPQYFQPAYAHVKFPTVLALTGYPGESWSIVRRLNLPAVQETLVKEGKITPTVDVMMNASVAMPRDTECTNIPAGPQVETFFAVDVPIAIEHSFRVQSGPGGWAALGYSTGGFCAVKMAMMNPGQFSLAISIAGYYTSLQDRTTGDLYGNNIGYRDENSPDWRLQHLPAPPISVLVTSSKVGEKTYPGTLTFVSLVRPPMQVYTLYLPQGGHNFRTWGRELPQALVWLSKRLSPALPAPAAGHAGAHAATSN